MTARWRAPWLWVRRLGQRIGILRTPRRYGDYKPTVWSEIRHAVGARHHRKAILNRRWASTSASASGTFVGWRARWLGNRDIGLPVGAEGTVIGVTPANDNGRPCYRIEFGNAGPVVYTYLPAPGDVELIPIGH